MRPTLVASFVALMASAPAAAAACDLPVGKSGTRSVRTPCPAAAKRFEPYDPDRVRAGGRQGYISSGSTEIRVGGRTRIEYGYTR